MFSRAFQSIVVVSLVAFFGVAKGGPTATGNSSQCETGNMACCNQVLDPTTNQALGGLLGLLGLGSILGNVGFDCDPINVLGIGNGGDCTAQVVCCTNVSENGLVNLGCSPFNLDL